MRYIPIGHDNRGLANHPFGFVYLGTKKDGTAIGRIGYGSHREDNSLLAIWPCNETPCDLDIQTWTNAQAYLGKVFPALVGKTA